MRERDDAKLPQGWRAYDQKAAADCFDCGVCPACLEQSEAHYEASVRAQLSKAISAGLAASAAFNPAAEKSKGGPWAALDEVARLRSALQEIARFRAMTLQPSAYDAVGWSLIALTLEQLAVNALNSTEKP